MPDKISETIKKPSIGLNLPKEVNCRTKISAYLLLHWQKNIEAADVPRWTAEICTSLDDHDDARVEEENKNGKPRKERSQIFHNQWPQSVLALQYFPAVGGSSVPISIKQRKKCPEPSGPVVQFRSFCNEQVHAPSRFDPTSTTVAEALSLPLLLIPDPEVLEGYGEVSSNKRSSRNSLRISPWLASSSEEKRRVIGVIGDLGDGTVAPAGYSSARSFRIDINTLRRPAPALYEPTEAYSQANGGEHPRYLRAVVAVQWAHQGKDSTVSTQERRHGILYGIEYGEGNKQKEVKAQIREHCVQLPASRATEALRARSLRPLPATRRVPGRIPRSWRTHCHPHAPVRAPERHALRAPARRNAQRTQAQPPHLLRPHRARVPGGVPRQPARAHRIQGPRREARAFGAGVHIDDRRHAAPCAWRHTAGALASAAPVRVVGLVQSNELRRSTSCEAGMYRLMETHQAASASVALRHALERVLRSEPYGWANCMFAQLRLSRLV
ncbi:hypothetical protein FB451DRAFT_1188505 [Mycena latifolia]|nr:hypothetical protein FB451DRAFT_1188505 [Mycena latifolia]